MRKLKTGKVNKRALDIIGKNYNKLRAMCNISDRGCYCSKSYEDIFQETILYVVHDKESFAKQTEKELIEYFLYKFKMIEFQTINDDKMLKEVKYAEYLQAKETACQED